MGVNKVEVNGEAIVDLTNDSVTPETLAEGETAHNKAGDPIVGKMSRQVEWDNVLNKPFTVVGSDTFTCDGATGDKLVVADVVYKVSDVVPIEADFTNGANIDLGFAQSEVTIDTSNNGMYVLVAFNTPFAYIVYEPNSVINGATFPETGIYYDYNLMGGRTTMLTINGFGGFNVAEVLNPENLPEHTHNEEVVTTTGTSTVYEASVPRITALTAGVTFIMKPHIQSASTSIKLNVNGLGAKNIYRRGTDASSYHNGHVASWLKANQAYRLMYNGSYWIVTDFVKPSAADLDGRVPVANGGVPSVGVSNNGKVLTIENDTPTWKEPTGGNVNTSDLATVDKITEIDACYGGESSFVMSDDVGIGWGDTFCFTDADHKEIAKGSITQKIPLVAGNNVSFEVDETNKVVKINSSGGGNVDTSNLATVDKIGEIYNNEGDTEIAYADESGIAWADTFGIYDDNGETIKYGALYPHIPLVAGNGIEFEIDEENQKVKINATGGGSDDSIVGTWVFKDEPTFEGIAYAVPYYFNFSDASGQSYSFIEFLNQDYGVSANFIRYCTEAFYNTAYVSQPAAWLSGGWVGDHYKTITITEEPTDETFISWLKANATKQSGTSKAEMPQIRFTSANGCTMDNEVSAFYVDVANPLKLTVEVTGGALQVGDALQVCTRKRFNGSEANGYKRKYKLQRFAEYIVTEEDLDKRFLTVQVFGGSGNALTRGLFRDGKIAGASPLYLRIRRPKGNMQNNDSGQTVDAEFSNIVTIWKSHFRSAQVIRIY